MTAHLFKEGRLPDQAAWILFSLLLNTLLFNCRFSSTVNLYLSDIFLVGLLGLAALRWRSVLEPSNRVWGFLFGSLLLYYSILSVYACFAPGYKGTLIVGHFRYLFFYPLAFFAGLSFTISAAARERYVLFIQVHVLLAMVSGMIGISFPGLALTSVYEGGRIVPPQYFMLVTPETALLCCFLFAHAALSLATGRGARPRHVFFLAASLAGILGTQNRSVLITLLLTTGLLFWAGRKAGPETRTRLKGPLLAMALLLGCFSLVGFLSPLREKFQKRFDDTISFFTNEKPFFRTIPGIRLARSLETIRVWKESPLLGQRWGETPPVFPIRDWSGKVLKTLGGTSHNYYLVLLYSTGLVGFALVMLLHWILGGKVRPTSGLDGPNVISYALYLFYAGVMVHAVANVQLYGHPVFIPVFFFLLGAAAARFPAVAEQEAQP